MNGARTTHMWKGYLLTALAAGVLLAASPGVVSAQTPNLPPVTTVELAVNHGERGIEISVPQSVAEGESGQIFVSIRATGAKAGTDGMGVALTPPAEEVEVKIVLEVLGVANPVLRATLAEQRGVDFDNERGSDVVYSGKATSDVAAAGMVTITFDVEPEDTDTYTAVFYLDAGVDSDAEDENVRLTYSESNSSGATVSNLPNDTTLLNNEIVIDDTETQTYVMGLQRRAVPKEGSAFIVEVEADPEHVDGTGELTLQLVDEDGKRNLDYTVSEPADFKEETTVNITTPDNDGNRVADTITLEAYTGAGTRATRVAFLDIDVGDVHGLPSGDAVTAVAMDKARRGSKVTEVEEGGDPVYLTVTVDRGSGGTAKTKEALTIDLTVADTAQASDYDLTPSRVTLPMVNSANGKQSTTAEIMLTARKNDDVGDENLTLNLTVSGEAINGPETETGTFEITIVDVTKAVIEPKEQDEAYPRSRTRLMRGPAMRV